MVISSKRLFDGLMLVSWRWMLEYLDGPMNLKVIISETRCRDFNDVVRLEGDVDGTKSK